MRASDGISPLSEYRILHKPFAVSFRVDLRHRLQDPHGLHELSDDATSAMRQRVALFFRPPEVITPEIVASATADGRPVVVFSGRFRRLLLILEQGAAARRDDVALQPDCRPGSGDRFQFVLPFVLGVHGEESEDEQVHGGRENRQTEEYEDQTEDDVFWTFLKVLALEDDVVPEPDCRQRDDAIVERFEIGPLLDLGEDPGPADDHDAGHVHADEYEVRLGHFDRFESQASLHVPQQEGHEDVEALTDALEHDEVERDAE